MVSTVTVFGQNAANKEPQPAEAQVAIDQSDLPRFNLDFPGGTPHQLVDFIRAEIELLNVIIPNEHKDAKLPPMKLKNVNVAELFRALEAATRQTVPYVSGFSSSGPSGNRRIVSEKTTGMGFLTLGPGPIRPESVWTFYVNNPITQVPEERMVRYFNVKPYLETYQIEDITTAVQEGWKMLDANPLPELSFHEDTKLLIAAGRPAQLEIIESVLAQLRESMLSGRPMPGILVPPPQPNVN
jgi:hypothetical protein